MFNRTIMYAKLAWVYAKGICGFRRNMPWPGDRYNLAVLSKYLE